MLDVRTLLVAVAVVTAFSALARIALCRMHPTIPGLWRWAWASILGAVGLALVAARDHVSVHFSYFLPQILVAGAYILAWDGFRRFLGRVPLSLQQMGMWGAPALVPLALFSVLGIGGLNSALNALLISVLSAAVTRELARQRAGLGLASRLTMWVYGANSVFFLFRLGQILVTREWPALGAGTYSQSFVLPLIWWLCMTVAVTLCMALMTSERLERELKEQASRDPLTGALNRRAFSAIVDREMARLARSGGPLSVVVMDLDHFKQINDLMGHGMGDQVLCRFVAVAEGGLRAGDAFCRFGGEEFLAMLPDTAAPDALVVAERIRTSFAADSGLMAGPVAYTVSIGIAQLVGAESFESLVSRADHALYKAKANGRDRCETADMGAVAFAGHGL